MGIEAEANNEENVDIDFQALANTEDLPVDEPNDLPELSDVEQKAFDQGWRPLDEFSGGEDNWKTAKEYVRDGEFLATIKDLNKRIDSNETEFNRRLENTNKLHEARRNQEISDLERDMRDAVEMSDTDAYDAAKGKKSELEKETVSEPVVQNTDNDISEWNKKNPWFFEAGEKSNDAKSFYNSYMNANPNATTAQALGYLDKKISQIYPTDNENPRRNGQNSTETPAKRGKRGAKTLTMNDLTSAEKGEFSKFGHMFKGEQEFLKAALDARKA